VAVLRVVYGPRAVEIVSLDPDRHYAWLHFAAKRARDDATARLLAVSHGAIDGSDLAILVPASWPADPAVEHAAIIARAFNIECVNLASLIDCQRLWERVQRRRVA
jgi:hypothetical protein